MLRIDFQHDCGGLVLWVRSCIPWICLQKCIPTHVTYVGILLIIVLHDLMVVIFFTQVRDLMSNALIGNNLIALTSLEPIPNKHT